MSDLRSLHDTDFFAWTMDQAEALRAAGTSIDRPRPNRPIDWDAVAAEIEAVGKSLRRALASEIRRVLHHLLKLEFVSTDLPHGAWRRAVLEARIAIADILDESPSLSRDVPSIAAKQMVHAVRLAAADFRDHGEAEAEAQLRAAGRSYAPETEVIADWWPT